MYFLTFCTLLLFTERALSLEPTKSTSVSHLTSGPQATPTSGSQPEVPQPHEKELPSPSYKLYSVTQRNVQPQQQQNFHQQNSQQNLHQNPHYSINYRPVRRPYSPHRSTSQNVPQKHHRIAHLYSASPDSSQNFKPRDILREITLFSNTHQALNSTPLLSDSAYESLFGPSSDSGFDRQNSAFLDLFSPERNIVNEFGTGDEYGTGSEEKKNDYGGFEEKKKNDYGGFEEKKKNDYGDFESDRKKSDFGFPEDRKKNDYGFPEDRKKNDYGFPEDRKKNDYGFPEDRKKNDFGFPEDRKKNDYGGYEERKKDDSGTMDENYEHREEEKKDSWGEEDRKREEDYGSDDGPFDSDAHANSNPIIYHSHPYHADLPTRYSTKSSKTSKYRRDYDYNSDQIPVAIRSEHTLQTYPVKADNKQSNRHAIIDIKSGSSLPLTLNFHTESTQIRAQQSHRSPSGSVRREILMEQPDVLIKVVKKPVIQQVREIILPLRHRLQEVRPVYEHVETVVAKDQQNYQTGSGHYGDAYPQQYQHHGYYGNNYQNPKYDHRHGHYDGYHGHELSSSSSSPSASSSLSSSSLPSSSTSSSLSSSSSSSASSSPTSSHSRNT